MNEDSVRSRRMARFRTDDQDPNNNSSFGERRGMKNSRRKGTRPTSSNGTTTSRRVERRPDNRDNLTSSSRSNTSRRPINSRYKGPQGSSLSGKAEDAAYIDNSLKPDQKDSPRFSSNRRSQNISSKDSKRNYTSKRVPRDNSSRFDD